METKTVVVAKDGVALLGNHYHILCDRSKNTFKTSTPKDFIDYLQTHRLQPGRLSNLGVFYNDKQIVATSLIPEYNSEPIAICSLKISTPLSNLIGLANSGLVKLPDLELILYKLRNYFDGTPVKELLDRTRDYKMEKVTRVEMKKDNQGNYLHTIYRKGTTDDVDPIEKISFTMPVFDGMNGPEHCININLDSLMDYREIEGSVIIAYRFLNPELDDLIRNRMIEIIGECLKPIDMPKFWGSLECINNTDSWIYEANQVKE
jgi:hypothetical protein